MASTPEPAPLEGTQWVLVELAGDEVALEEGARVPYIELDLETSRLAGSGGVNRLVGGFVLEGDALRLGPVATTLMAGTEPAMRREAAFVAALERVSAYELEGTTLRLLDGEGVVARFSCDSTAFGAEPRTAPGTPEADDPTPT